MAILVYFTRWIRVGLVNGFSPLSAACSIKTTATNKMTQHKPTARYYTEADRLNVSEGLAIMDKLDKT